MPKLYNVTLSFLEPVEAVTTIQADSEQDAMDVAKTLFKHRAQLEILQAVEVEQLPLPNVFYDYSGDQTVN